MRILHLFDRYLNHTMNWAYRLLRYGPSRPIVAAPILVQNEFLNPRFEYLPSIWPRPFSSEWHIATWKQALSSLFWKHSRLYQRRLYHLLKNNPPDLLHAHFAQTGWYFLHLAKALQKPLITSFYGYDYERLPYLYPKWKHRYQQLFQQAATLLVEGPHGAKLLRQMGCPSQKIQIFPLGIDLSNKTAFRQIPAKRHPFQLLQAATFTPKKGQMDSLRAFHLALQKAPDMELTFVGEVVNRQFYQQIRNYISKHQLQSKVHILNFVPFGKFYNFLAQYHLFLQPSRYATDQDCEGGAPLSLLDAQFVGLPVLTTQHCDIPSRLLPEQSGLLCKEGDIHALAQGILRFYNMPEEEYKSFAQTAHEFVKKNFDAQKCGKKLKAIYENTISSKKA